MSRKLDAGIRNAQHFVALGACMALKTLRIELETSGLPPEALAPVLKMIDRRTSEASTEDTEVKA